MTYKVESSFIEKGLSSFQLGEEIIKVDVSKGREESLPGPAELLLTAFSSCILKNIERFSELLKFEYSHVKVETQGDRRESPPKFIEIRYKILIETNETEQRLDLLHRNIKKFGTVYNSISEETVISGIIEKL